MSLCDGMQRSTVLGTEMTGAIVPGRADCVPTGGNPVCGDG
jgi:hypothetical protein